jgi:tetratricopeptide (TPR) repeat protein
MTTFLKARTFKIKQLMKKFLTAVFISLTIISDSQVNPLSAPPPGGNKKAWTGERIGITDVMITYDRPGVKGRDGKIYGTPVVHEGFQDLGFGSSKAAPWRAGANENTTIEFSTAVKIEGKDLAAGKYGFFVAYNKDECTLIFSKENAAWGSFFYDDKEDALRVKVKPVPLTEKVEWLKYEFTNQTDNSAVIALQWEKTSIPFKVEVDLINTSLSAFRQQLKSDKGFNWQAFEQAASFCVEHNTNYEEGLTWSNTAVLFNPNFQTLATKSALLDKSGRKTQADSAMKAALPLGTMFELHQYGKQLLAQKKSKEALEVFKVNAAKNPKQFTTYAGLTRGYSAIGDYKTALANAKLALPLAPNPPNKAAVEEMIKKLETGKDVN